jgi:hypothetical protein
MDVQVLALEVKIVLRLSLTAISVAILQGSQTPSSSASSRAVVRVRWRSAQEHLARDRARRSPRLRALHRSKNPVLERIMTTNEIEQMSNDALVAETKRLAEVERRSMAELLTLLIEVERRGLCQQLGCSSMFTYCTRVLGLSEQAAYSRINAARAAVRFPAMLPMLAEGALTLSSVGLLAPHLDEANHEVLLDAARHKSTRDVQRLLACAHPQPDIPASVRALPAAEAERATIAPLSPKRYLLKVTIGQETHDKLHRARDLLRHSVPDGDPAAILDRALTLLLREAERTKFAATARPRRAADTPPRPAGPITRLTRKIPAAVKREVWARDGGRCAFIGTLGRCPETARLEFHHVIPFAAGGTSDAGNLQIRCRSHNTHEARLFFGAELAAGTSP